MKSWWIPLTLAGCLLTSAAWAEMLTVAVDTANFREAPCTKSAILFTADKYFTVKVLERKNEWVKTQDFEGDIAWVAERLLEKQSAVVVHVPAALVREGPDRESRIVFKAEKGEGMLVTGRQGAWLNVTNVAGSKGWVHRDVVWGDK